MTTIYYRFEPDRIVEVLNSHRDPAHDVMVGRDLDSDERDRYDRLKESGHTDASIYEVLNGCIHDSPPDRLSVPVHLLSREQCEHLGRRIKGLSSLEREDLLVILGGLSRMRMRVG